MSEPIIAKNFNGNYVLLTDHSQYILNEMVAHIPERVKTSKLIALVKIAAKLHDIGKATPWFQEIVKHGNDEHCGITLSNGEGYTRLYHNETGAMYLQLLNVQAIASQLSSIYGEQITATDVYSIIEMVEYSHGVSKFSQQKHSMSELAGLTCAANGRAFPAIDIGMLDRAYEAEFGVLPPHKPEAFEDKPEEVIKYLDARTETFPDPDGQFLPVFLIALLKGVELDLSGMNRVFTQIDIGSLQKPEEFDSRFYDQIGIVRRMLAVDGMMAIEACTGYGKTAIALMYALAQDKLTYIVAPQNDLVDDLANTVRDTLSKLKLETVGWQAVHGGKVVASGGDQENVRIKIINIDAFISPYSSSYSAADAYNMLTCPAIFDEVQSYVSEAPIYAAFDVILKVRAKLGVHTVLSSATNDCMFDDNFNLFHTEVINDNGVPFMFGGDTEYTFNVVHDSEMEPEDIPNTPDTAYIAATVERSQRANMDIYYNSYQDADTKDAARRAIFDTAGRNGTHSKSVSSCQMMKEGINVSFNRGMIIDFVSLTSMNQALGRTIRDKKNGHIVVHVIIHSDEYLSARGNKGYAKVIESKIGVDNYHAGIEFVKEYLDGKTLTKREIYALYKQYCTDNFRLFRRFLYKQKDAGLEAIRNGIDVDVSFNKKQHMQMAPKRVRKQEVAPKAYSPTNYRSPGFSYYLTAQDMNGELCGPISYSNTELVKKMISTIMNAGSSPYTILKNIATLAAKRYPELTARITEYLKNHSEVDREKGKELLFRLARCEDTPLVAPDVNAVYDRPRGLRLTFV